MAYYDYQPETENLEIEDDWIQILELAELEREALELFPGSRSELPKGDMYMEYMELRACRMVGRMSMHEKIHELRIFIGWVQSFLAASEAAEVAEEEGDSYLDTLFSGLPEQHPALPPETRASIDARSLAAVLWEHWEYFCIPWADDSC